MDKIRQSEISKWIHSRTEALGFQACGIASAGYLEEDDRRLAKWLEMGYHGEMGYMARNLDKRPDPRKLLPGAKSVIMVLRNYFPARQLPAENNYRIAKYAYGKDYHEVIRDKLNLLVNELKEKFGPLQARAFTDSAPVLERAWAQKAGLGRIGKNTCLIHPKLGSFVFIAEIITDLELEPDLQKVNDLCGGCTRCIDACPTGAIISPGWLDSRKCISYHTIESRSELPVELQDKFGDWIFGCDICQDVCPWNRKATPNEAADLMPKKELMEMDKTLWENLDEDQFKFLFENSAVKRTGFLGLKRNISFVKK